MEKFETFSGIVAAIDRSNIDTDAIIPKQYLKSIKRSGFGIKVVIAPSFADIFYNNSFKNGLLPIALDTARVDSLFQALAANREYRLTVDLENKRVITPEGDEMSFEIDEFRKYCLLNGLDDIGLTMQHADEIREFERRYYQNLPWLK